MTSIAVTNFTSPYPVLDLRNSAVSDGGISPVLWFCSRGVGKELLEVFQSIDANDDLDPKTKELLGADGLARYEMLRASTPSTGERPMSDLSVAVMSAFVASLNDLNFEPSLFLTNAGNLEFGWDDSNGNQISLEFFPDKIEYYIEKSDDEGEVNADSFGMKSIVAMLD